MNDRVNDRHTPAIRALYRGTGIAAAAAGLLAATVLTAPTAAAAPADPAGGPDASAAKAAKAAFAVEKKLGADGTAGSYLNDSGEMVVTVTDRDDAADVREAGAVVRVVEHSKAELGRAAKAIEKDADIAGTSWVVDPSTGTLEVNADSTVSGKEMALLKKVAKRYGDAVSVERIKGEINKLISGGDGIWTSGWRCSAGFNARTSSGTQYMITAGHCTDGAGSWYADPSGYNYIGPSVVSSFPTNDYGIISYDSSISRPGNVYLYNGSYRDITGAANAYVGQYVLRSGYTTGLHGGYVTGLNATVNYGGGDVVYGLIRTDVCAEGGDSGGALFAGNTALGLTSGGSGNCSSGGTTFFQPVTEVLNRYGLSVY